MPITATFAADFKAFYDAVQQSTVKLKDFQSNAETVARSVDKVANAFSGRKVIQDAEIMTKAIKEIGGATALTAKEQAQVNAKVSEAIEKYRALGQTAPKEMLDLAKATAEVPKQLTLADKAAGVLSSTFGQFTAAGIATQLIGGLTTKIGEFAAAGAKLPAIEGAFKRLASVAGQSTGEMLSAMQDGTRGMVSNIDLMQSANKALLLGLPVTASTMGELSSAATTLGRAMGQDATKSLDDLISALGRSSPMILDNLGLSVKVGEANEKFAQSVGKTAETLTDAEKKMAFYNAAMEAARQKTKELGESSKTLGEILQTTWVTVGNQVTSAVGFYNTSLGHAAGSTRGFFQFMENVKIGGVVFALHAAKDTAEALAAGTAAAAARAEAASKGFRLWNNELEHAAKTMPKLTAEQWKHYDAAVKLHATEQQLTEQFGLSKIQQELRASAIKDGTKATKEANKAEEEYAKLLAEDVVQAYEETRKALVEYYKIILLANDSINIGTEGIQLRKNTEVDALSGITGQWLNYLKAVDSVNAKVTTGITTMPGTKVDTDFLAGIWGKDEQAKRQKELDKAKAFGAQFIGTIISAIQGGGGVGQAVGATLGQSIGNSLGGALSKAIGGKLGSMLGGMLGPLGALGGELIGKLGDKLFGKLFGKGQGREAVEAFAEGLGGFDALQKQLEALGEEGARLWVKLTQGTDKGNPEQAARHIAEVEEALRKHKEATDDVTGATEEQARATIETASEAERAMKELEPLLKANEDQWRAWGDVVNSQIDRVASALRSLALPTLSGAALQASAPTAGGGGTAVINLDGRQIAEAVVPRIPGVVKRYGLA